MPQDKIGSSSTIGFVGGNAEVAVGVSLDLNNQGHEVVPIVRNSTRGAFLAQQGMEPRVGSVLNSNRVSSLLDNLDVIVIAAQVSPLAGETETYRETRRRNRQIIEATVRNAPNSATLIYFSSIVARGGEYNPGGRLNMYMGLKRDAEKRFHSVRSEEKIRGYAFRLAPVIGPHQSGLGAKVKCMNASRVVANVDPDLSANIVNTVTISEVLQSCLSPSFDSGTYTLVNQPRWTWEEFLNSYLPPETHLTFNPVDNESRFGVITRLKQTVLSYTEPMIPVLLRLPRRVFDPIYTRYKIRTTPVPSTLPDDGTRSFSSASFTQPPVPDDEICQVSVTRCEILDRESVVASSLSPETGG